MWDVDALLAVAPVLGLAVYCMTHVAVCRLGIWKGPYMPLTAGACLGLIAAVGVTVAVLWSVAAGFGDAAAKFALNLLTYLALAFGYFNFINLNVAALRIRMLQELLAAGGSLPRERLLALYNTEHVIELRMARLTRGGHLAEADGRYYRGKVVKFLIVARVFDILHWIILGPGRPTGPCGSQNPPTAKIEGAP